MDRTPKSVIHINFVPIDLAFDARTIWRAMRCAETEGRLAPGSFEAVSSQLGNTAIHLATRDYIMRSAVQALKASVSALADTIPLTLSLDQMRQPRVLHGGSVAEIRDRILLAVDSFLFEFRAFLELLAAFCYELMRLVGREPAAQETLSDGTTVTLLGKNGRLNTNGFLRFLCDRTHNPTNWYRFLVRHRNFFTHEAAPYCAIEDRLMIPPEYDLLIMRTNITDFGKADLNSWGIARCGSIIFGYLTAVKF
jgi:hypothetical protein